MQVGFIGLGVMGRAMAANLVKAGHEVSVWNRSAAPVEALVRQGARAATSPADVFSGDAVVSMFSDDNATRQVVLASGALDHAAPHTVHVNMATISAALAKELGDAHAKRGTAYVAAPVFGRPDVAAAAQLHIVAAGPAAAIDRVQPLLDAMGQKTWRVGDDPYRANVIKIAGNFLIASAIESMAEAVALVRRHGLEASDLLDIATNTFLASPVYKNYGGLIARRQYEPPAFLLKLGLKDVRLALAEADTVGVPMPFAGILRDNHLDAIAHGAGELDWVALAEVAQRRAGLGEPASPTSGKDAAARAAGV